MNWIKKTTSLILSIAMLTSTMFVGSLSTTAAENNVSSSGSDDVYTSGTAPNDSWQGKSLAEIKKLYTDVGGDCQYYNEFVSDQEDFNEAISAIKDDGDKCMLHIIVVDGADNGELVIDKQVSIPSNTYVLFRNNVKFIANSENGTQGKLNISGSYNVALVGEGVKNITFNLATGNAVQISNSSKNVVVDSFKFSGNTITTTKDTSKKYISASNSSELFISNITFEGKATNGFYGNNITSSVLNLLNTSETFCGSTEASATDSAITLRNCNSEKDTNNTIQNCNLYYNNSDKFVLKLYNTNWSKVDNCIIDGKNKSNGILISADTNENYNYDGNSVTNSLVKNCADTGISITNNVKNTTINNVGVSNCTSYGIFINPNYPEDLEDNDCLANISDCSSTDICVDSTTSSCVEGHHIHNNGVGIYITTSQLADNNFAQSIEANLTNNIICCNTTGIQTPTNNPVDLSVNISKITFKNNDTNIKGDGIIDLDSEAQTANDTSEDAVQSTEDTSKFIGRTTGIEYYFDLEKSVYATIQKGPTAKNAVKETDAFKIPSKIVLRDSNKNEIKTTFVRKINSNAFSNSHYLGNGRVVIPNSVVSIKERAFAYCEDLKSVYIGTGSANSGVQIGDFAFLDCPELVEIEVAKAQKTSKDTEYIKTTYTKNLFSDKGMLYSVIKENIGNNNGEASLLCCPNKLKNNSTDLNDIKVYIHSDTVLKFGLDNASTTSMFNDYVKTYQVYLYDTETGECYFPDVKNFTEIKSISGGTNIVFKNVPRYAHKLRLKVKNDTYAAKVDNRQVITETDDSSTPHKVYQTFTVDSSSSFTLSSEKTDVTATICEIPDSISATTPKQINVLSNQITCTTYSRKFNCTTLHYDCFYSQENLTKLVFGTNVKELKYRNGYSKENSKLESDHVTSDGPFMGLTNVSEIYVKDGNNYLLTYNVDGSQTTDKTDPYNPEGKVLSYYKGTVLYGRDENNEHTGLKDEAKLYLFAPDTKDTTLKVVNQVHFSGTPNLSYVTTIANFACAYNSSLKDVDCSASTKLYKIGIRAFYKTNLKNLEWNAPDFKDINGTNYYNTSKSDKNLPAFLKYALGYTPLNDGGYYNRLGIEGTTNEILLDKNDADNDTAKYSHKKLRLGYSEILLNDSLKINGQGNLIKEAVQDMHSELYKRIIEKVEEKALANESSIMSEDVKEYLNKTIINDFFKYADSEIDEDWNSPKDSNTLKTGENNGSTSVLNKYAKWTNSKMTEAELNVDYTYGNSSSGIDFLFVVDKTGSMNEVSEASRSKFYDQYSTVYNASKGILSGNGSVGSVGNNRVGIIKFSNEKFTEALKSSYNPTESEDKLYKFLEESNNKLPSYNNSETNKTYQHTFGLTYDEFFTEDLNQVDEFMSKSDDPERDGGTTNYDCAMNSVRDVIDSKTQATSTTKGNKLAIIFISDGIPATGHYGKEEAKDLRTEMSKNFPDSSLFTILELAGSNEAACKGAMGNVTGIDYHNNMSNDELQEYERFNKSGKNPNELSKAFSDIYNKVTETKKQVLQDTISTNFNANSITFTKYSRVSDYANIAVDIDKTCDNKEKGYTFYEELSKKNFSSGDTGHIKLVVTMPNGSSETTETSSETTETVYPTKRFVTDEHIRYIFRNVPNSDKYYYNVQLYNSGPLGVNNNKKGINNKTKATGLLRLSLVNSQLTLDSQRSLTATIPAKATSQEETATFYANINKSCDDNSSMKYYNKLSQGNYPLFLVVTKEDGTKTTLSSTNKVVTDKYVRYIFDNVPNSNKYYYNVQPYNFGPFSSENSGKGILREYSEDVFSVDYQLNSSGTGGKYYVTSSNSINDMVEWQATEYTVCSDTSKLSIGNTYYYLKSESTKNEAAKFEYGSSTVEVNEKNSLDGIIIKLNKDSTNKITVQVFLNRPETLARYNLNFDLTLKSDKTSIYGKYFETNHKGETGTDGSVPDKECFVVDNSEDEITYNSDIADSTKYSDNDIMNSVASPKLYRQKYGYIKINLNKESFNGFKYELQGNSQSKEYAELTMYSTDLLADMTKVEGYFDDKISVSESSDSTEILRVPRYDTNGEAFNFIVKQNSIPIRFSECDDTKISYKALSTSTKAKPYEVTINDLLKKGYLEIKKKAFDNQIEGLNFNISDDNNYNERVTTDSDGIAKPSAKATSSGSTTTKLPLYDANDNLITYIVTEMGIENANGTYSIPRKYNPKVKTIEKNLLEDETVTFDYDNVSRDDFSTKIDNINNICYGDTGSNKTLTSYDKGSYKYEIVDSNGNTSTTAESTNNNGNIYENQIGSFDVTFTNNVNDSIPKTALCEIKVDGEIVFSKTLSFNALESKTYRVLYDYSWNIDVRNVEAYINYDNRESEIIGTDNSATATLEPLEWIDFSVKIMGIYEDKACTAALTEDKDTDRYYYANKGQQVYVKTKFINKNKGRAYKPVIRVMYGTKTVIYQSVPEPIPAGNSSGDGYIITAIPITADNVKSIKDITIRINWDDRDKEANPNDNEDKVTLEVRKVLDLSIEPIVSNADYYNGYEVITSFMVYNQSKKEAVLPDDEVKVKFTAFTGEEGGAGTKIYEATKTVVIPYCLEGEKYASNLVYFKWKVPTDNKASKVYWMATINEDKVVYEGDYSDNTTVIENGQIRFSLEKTLEDGSPYEMSNLDCMVDRKEYIAKVTPSTKYEETSADGYIEQNVGRTFDYITPEDQELNQYNNQAVWSEWTYDESESKFNKQTYGQTIGKFTTYDIDVSIIPEMTGLIKNGSHSKTVIVPDKNSPTVERDEDGNYTMRSGYGFGLKYTPETASFHAINNSYNHEFDSLTSEEKAERMSNSTTGIQMASAYYPEFMYLDEAFYDENGDKKYTCTTLERGTIGTNTFDFKLPMNSQSASILSTHKEDSRIHFIPVWYKNGDYNISIVASYAWTPAGAISTCDNSTNINIEGSVYDDWYLKGDAH